MNNENRKNISIKNYIIIILAVIIVLIAGTYAWLSYRSNNTQMVLTIGEINDVQVTLSPYKIVSTISPVSAYTDQTNYSTVTVKNNNASSRMINLYYHINNIPDALKISGFKYTITKSTDNSTYTFIKTDSFSSASSNSDFVIYEDSVNSGTTYYRVYVWLDTNDGGNQASAQGATFDAELLSSIYKYTVTFDPNGGTVDTTSKTVAVGDTYGDLPTPTRPGYTFKGWNGKNKFNVDAIEGLPSNLATSNSTKRTFTEYTHVKGLAVNNYYIPARIENYIVNSGTMSFTSSSGYGVGFPIITSGGKKYIVSYDCISPNSNGGLGVLYYGSDGTVIDFSYATVATGYHTKTFTTPSDTYYLVVDFYTYSTANVSFSNIQLEEGTEATAYEPYYVTSDTTVVQKNNHTLKAIWEPVS